MALLLIAAAVVLLAIAAGIMASRMGPGDEKEMLKYQYTAKRFFLTRAEHEFYDVLNRAVGNEYRLFAQVSLGSILDEKVTGQNWRAAHAHINQKSVDYLLCDSVFLSPKLAIELDDKSHEREDRKERDEEVERILKAAGIPLLRVPNHGPFDADSIGTQIRAMALK